jgi:monoamine oxidase
MPRSASLQRLLRAWHLANDAESRRLSTRDALARRHDAEHRRGPSRRQFIQTAAASAAAAATASVSPRPVFGAAPRVAIVGGGLAGLACADRLQAKGVAAVVYEGAARLGGRCFSNRTLVPGMVCENGGELIDTGHKTMLGYANEFDLELESYVKKRGDETFWFFGRSWSDEEVVDQFRTVVSGMRRDLRAISGSATFFEHTPQDAVFDNLDLASYFASRTAGLPLIQAVLNEAYLAEYGLETWQQSTLNFLGFMRLNRQSKFEPFGVSDERYHLVDGNDGIISGLRQKIRGPIVTGARLTKLARTASGAYQLFFNGSSQPERADAVVLAVPFTVLRGVELDSSLGLSSDKRRAIETLGYGTNAKTMVAFEGRPWAESGASGGVYADLPDLQATWETNRGRSTHAGILTDYASGDRGAALSPAAVQGQVDGFLNDVDVVFPGAKARAMRAGSDYVAHLEHWPSNPFALGSYTCYKPGQFTTTRGWATSPRPSAPRPSRTRSRERRT